MGIIIVFDNAHGTFEAVSGKTLEKAIENLMDSIVMNIHALLQETDGCEVPEEVLDAICDRYGGSGKTIQIYSELSAMHLMALPNDPELLKEMSEKGTTESIGVRVNAKKNEDHS